MRMLKENFISALRIAIYDREKFEKNIYGEYFESALLAGWKEVLEKAKDGEKITIE
jgi:hypothetical protein